MIYREWREFESPRIFPLRKKKINSVKKNYLQNVGFPQFLSRISKILEHLFEIT